MTDGQNDKKFSTWNPEAKCMVCTWLKKNSSDGPKKVQKRPQNVPGKVSKKQDRAILPKSKLLVYVTGWLVAKMVLSVFLLRSIISTFSVYESS